jgi:Asp/Glu/hydantoin racemase
MTRGIAFTQAQVRRAVRAAESAGLRVKSVTVKPDGSITIDSGETEVKSVDSPKMALASWDDA